MRDTAVLRQGHKFQDCGSGGGFCAALSLWESSGSSLGRWVQRDSLPGEAQCPLLALGRVKVPPRGHLWAPPGELWGGSGAPLWGMQPWVLCSPQPGAAQGEPGVLPLCPPPESCWEQRGRMGKLWVPGKQSHVWERPGGVARDRVLPSAPLLPFPWCAAWLTLRAGITDIHSQQLPRKAEFPSGAAAVSKLLSEWQVCCSS